MDRASQQRIDEILRYWFGDLHQGEDDDQSKWELWWRGGEEVDREIEQRFGRLVRAALDGQLEHWKETARGCLALVILLDQFTRNVGRGTAAAFVGDAQALAACGEAMDRRCDRDLRLIERAFLYMPMMHAEDREVAERSVETFEGLSTEIAEASRDLPDFLSHARQHAQIVQRFGRYPHRNAVCGRTPTSEEAEFLAAGGPTFGQSKKR